MKIQIINQTISMLISITLLFFASTCIADTFTIAVLPDTQSYVKSDLLNIGFESQTQWIVDNKDVENILFVTQLGDLVSEGGGSLIGDMNVLQWERANRALSILDTANIPWNIAVGNHDADFLGDYNSSYTLWKSYFGASTTGRYNNMTGWGGVSQDELSTFQYITHNGRTYLIMHLLFDIPDHTINWAQSIIDENPGLPTIISTHVYEGTNHGPPDSAYLPGPGRNSQLQIFEKLIKNNNQIFIVLSGHTGQEINRVRKNVYGNDVFQMVQDYAIRPNGGNGWMRLIEFDEDNSRIRVRTFTPGISGQSTTSYEEDENSQFSYYLDWNKRFGTNPQANLSTVDSFSLDTSNDYTFSNSYGTGGTYQINNGILQILPASQNTASVALDNGSEFIKPGELWAIDVLDSGNSFLFISSSPLQPNGINSFGFRLRRDTNGFRIETYTNNSNTLSSYYSNPSGPLTLYVHRINNTEFQLYYSAISGRPIYIDAVDIPEFRAINNLFIGMQSFQDTISFDNLRKAVLSNLSCNERNIDDFSNENNNFTLTDSYMSGGSYTIDNSVLKLLPANNNTVSMMLNDGENYMTPGSEWTIDLPHKRNSFFQISTRPEQPDGVESFGLRVRRDAVGIRSHTYSSGGSFLSESIEDPGGFIRFGVTRASAVDFNLFYEKLDQRTSIGSVSIPELLNTQNLYVGVQAYNDSAIFDNLIKRSSALCDQPTLFVDNFKNSQIYNYTITDSYGYGGSFTIANNTLILIPDNNNTVSVMLDNNQDFMTLGNQWTIDVLDDGNSFFQVSTIPQQADGISSFGLRLRRDPNGFRVQTYTGGSYTLSNYYPAVAGPIALGISWIDMNTFETFYKDDYGKHHIFSTQIPELTGNENLYIGVQAWEQQIRFDNLVKH